MWAGLWCVCCAIVLFVVGLAFVVVAVGAAVEEVSPHLRRSTRLQQPHHQFRAVGPTARRGHERLLWDRWRGL